MKKIHSNSTEETEAIGEKLAGALQGNEVIALYGGMGMGKTAFVRGLARGLGVSAEVSSPTFALVHEYRGRIPLYHFDMYRVGGWDDLYSTGFFDYLDSGAVMVIEWSENIEAALPDGVIRITLEKGNGEQERTLKIEGMEANETFGN